MRLTSPPVAKVLHLIGAELRGVGPLRLTHVCTAWRGAVGGSADSYAHSPGPPERLYKAD